MRTVEQRKDQLTIRLKELDVRLHEVEDLLEQTPDADWEENAVLHEDDEVLEELGQTGQIEIQAIRAALARIKDGTYGVCVKCGEMISEERLDAVPQTPLCRHCARH
ncbi:MAG: TraR/DksA family transcriptional regulator [Pseudomonadota bacterium]